MLRNVNIEDEDKEKTLMEELIEAGYPKEKMFNHYSDLYVFDTPLTRKVIKEWCDKKGYSINDFAARFKDQVTGLPMFDIVFAYDPYWEGIVKKEKS